MRTVLSSDHDLLDLIEAYLVAPAVVELRRARSCVICHCRGLFERARANPDGGLMDRITDLARQFEAQGLPGIWIGDSLAVAGPPWDSLQVLTALSAVTQWVKLGISVLQLPLRNPVELAHRVQSVQAMSNNRLISASAAARHATISSCSATITTTGSALSRTTSKS
jgi:hypothetical protein